MAEQQIKNNNFDIDIIQKINLDYSNNNSQTSIPLNSLFNSYNINIFNDMKSNTFTSSSKSDYFIPTILGLENSILKKKYLI